MLVSAVACLFVSSLFSSCGSLPKPRPVPQKAAAQPMKFQHATNSKAYGCTVPEIFDTGPQIRKKMEEMIEFAERYILIDSFLFLAEPTTLGILDALVRKHRAGVKIYVVADSSSRYKSGGFGLEYLRKAGIPCAEYNPFRLYKLPVAPVMLPAA